MAVARRNSREIDLVDGKDHAGDNPTDHRFIPTLEGRNDDLDYNMAHSKRGKAIIFSHSEFDRDDRTVVTKGDENALKEALEIVKFDVIIKPNLLLKEIAQELDIVAEADEVEADCDALMVIVLTRSEDGRLLWARDRVYDPSMIWSKFTGNNCPQLVGKPKIFLFQGLVLEKDDKNHNRRTGPDGSDTMKYPTDSDFLVCYSSGYGELDNEGGTSLVQNLCDVLKTYHNKEHILNMTSIICRRIQKEYESGVNTNGPLNSKCLPLFTHTLTGNAYLLEKNAEQCRDCTLKPCNEQLDGDVVYSMPHLQNSKVVIFSHQTFNSEIKDRPGTNADVAALKKVFRMLKFEVAVHHDLPLKDLETKLEKLSETVESDCASLMVVVLTHGEEGSKLWAKDRLYDSHKVWSKFTRAACPQLIGKPKMFLFQACLGNVADDGVHVRRTSSDFLPSSKYPDEADFFIGYSSTPGYFAFRRPSGSWFIQTFCKVMEEYHAKMDLLSMTQIICRKVALDYETFSTEPEINGKKNVPLFVHMLPKKVFF